MGLEFRLIRHALALGQHGNFARAAKALNLAQPTLSRSIASLESALGVPLFNRSHKGVTPTPFGRVLLQRGETVLKGEADLRREIRLLAGMEEGALAVGAGPYLAETSVVYAIAQVAQAHPNLRIRCSSDDPAEVVRAVLAERVDIGVAGIDGLHADARLEVEPLPAHRIYFACRPGHPLTREPSPSIKRALAYPLVTTLLRGAHAALAASRGETAASSMAEVADFVPNIQVNTVAMGRMLARHTDALFPGTAAVIDEDVAAGRLVKLNIDAPTMRTNPGVFYLRGRVLAPAARAFIEALRAVESEFQASEGAAGSAAAKKQTAAKHRPSSRRR